MNLPNGYLLQKGKYKLTQAIGQGGFGITYKGVWYTEVKGALGAMPTEVPVCIKEYFFKDYCVRDPQSFIVRVHSDTGKLLFNKFKEKLIKEAKILSEVHHPYIVNVLEVFEENNTAYIAMEYISGDSLKDKLAREGVLPEAQVLHYIRQIGEALQFVHQKNILHLDIKPSNILIDKEGKARLIDFGVSKRYDVGEQETSTTMLTLSKGFASIEQYDNEGIQSFSPCPDVYSLGATMYNLLTGKIPTESILRATRPLPAPRTLNPAISRNTEQVILKAMEIIPANRYQSIAEMMDALDFSPDAYGGGGTALPSAKTEEEAKAGTTLLQDAPRPQAEDDETILDTPGPAVANADGKGVPGKKGKRRKGVILVAVLLFLAGAAAGSWKWYEWQRGDAPVLSGQEPAQPAQSGRQIPGTVGEKDSDRPGKRTASNPPADAAVSRKDAGRSSQPTEVKKEKAKEPKTSTSATGLPEKEAPVQKTNAVVETKANDAAYDQLLAAARQKMAEKDYAGASNDLSKAKKLKVTEEAVRLQINCDQQLEKMRVEERKSQYVEMMSFGPFKVVRKKDTGRYGAIDANGNEVIPCKYLSVGKAENGRAFEREDNLFDIYGSDGKIITRGATYY